MKRFKGIAPSFANLFQGGSHDFEQSVGGWQINDAGGNTLSISSTSPISENYSLLNTVVTGGYYRGCCCSMGALTAGKKYRVRFRYRVASGAWVCCGDIYPYYGGATIFGDQSLTADGTIREFVYEFTAASSFATAWVHVKQNSDNAVLLYLDDFYCMALGSKTTGLPIQ